MDEKKLSKLLEVLVEKIDNLEFTIRVKDISYKELLEENEKLKKENDTLRKDNVSLTREIRGEIVFRRIDKEEKDG